MNASAKVGLVGCGYWGKNLCRNFKSLGALGMVVDSTQSGKETATELAPGVPVSSSFDDVLGDDSIHAVALATPAETHAALSIKAMEAGKDVFVEKPMALNLEDADRMREFAEREGRVLMVGHLLEYHPAVLKLRELISNGELGQVNYVYSNRLNFGKVRTEENALWSFAPHDVAVILRLMGKSPIEASATGGSYLTEGLADVTVSNLRFENNSRAHIFVSWLHPFKEQRLVVVGDRKMAIFNDVAPFGEKLKLYPNSVEFEGEMPVLRKEDAQFVEHLDTEPLREECNHFLNCVSSREEPLTDAKSGIEVLKVLHACQASIGSHGAPVEI
tara:strand:- start:416 stop:1408 length:993 start_codon:yes stop_codon:yes gene_type:complete